MGLAGTIQSAISSGMKAFDDIRKSCTYHSMGTLVVNPATDVTVETGGQNYSSVMIIFSSYKLAEIDDEVIKKEDKKALIPQIDYPFVPKDTDYILQGSVRWEVQSVRIDPADAMWVLQVRRSELV